MIDRNDFYLILTRSTQAQFHCSRWWYRKIRKTATSTASMAILSLLAIIISCIDLSYHLPLIASTMADRVFYMRRSREGIGAIVVSLEGNFLA